jgi:hypothetical protein
MGSGAEPPKDFFWFVYGDFSANSFQPIVFFFILELGFWRLVNTLYCIVNILYNEMKEIKREVKL